MRSNVKQKIYLGIDPGTTRIGYGLIAKSGNSVDCVAYGVITSSGKDFPSDALAVSQDLTELIKRYKPHAVGVEKLFLLNNKKTAMAVSQMRGVILMTLAKHRLPSVEFTPLQVKQMITRYGAADKAQVQRMVKMILRMDGDIKPDDAADALAMAVCCMLVTS